MESWRDLKKRLDILRIHHKKCKAHHAAYAIAQMDLPIEMDSSSLSGSISDQPASTCNQSSSHRIPEKDHCCQSSNEHGELEAVDLRIKGNYRQTIGNLLFAKEQGAESLKVNTLKTLDSVVFDERHKPPATTCSRRCKEGQTSSADRPLEVNDDGDLDHQSTTSSPVERQKKTATKRRNDDNARSESDVDEEEQHAITRKSPADRQKKGATPKHDDYDADEESERDVELVFLSDGKEQPMMYTASPVKRRKKASTKQKHEEVSDEKEQSVTATKSSAKKGKKTASQRGNTDAKIQLRRPWTDREKSAVQRRMAKFIALKKVPVKDDCLLCIQKESPVLCTRTWKDIKHFVHNEIRKIKRKLEKI